jgi:hypothetical protein
VADLHRSGRVLVGFRLARVGRNVGSLGEGEAVATNPEEPPEERQRRELEEIRRKFHEVGARLGSAFEPSTPTDQEQPHQPLALSPPAPPLDRPARPRWQWLAAVALVFALGTGLGYLLPRSGAGAQPAPTPPQPSATTPAAPQPRPAPAPTVVPPSCLETARRADEVISLLNRNIRTRRLAEALKAYTLASQACREEASP